MPKHFTYFEIKEQCKGEVGLWFSFILFSKNYKNFGMTELLKLLNIVWNDVLDIGTMREGEREGRDSLCLQQYAFHSHWYIITHERNVS